MTAWVYMRHPDIDGQTLIPDSPDVIAFHESRGWERHVLPVELDPDAVNSGAVFEPLAETERILHQDEALELKGEALDEALEEAGLSKSGTADEKRARLAEHMAELADEQEESA